MDIKIQCAWCKKQMGTRKWETPRRSKNLKKKSLPISHSICASCQIKALEDFRDQIGKAYDSKRNPD